MSKILNNRCEMSEPSIFEAIEEGDVDLIKEIVKENTEAIKEELNGVTPFLHSIYLGKIDCMELLISLGANIYDTDKNNHQNALHIAAAGNYSKLLSILLSEKFKFDLNSQSQLNLTPLHLAAIFGAYDSASVLLEYGANPNKKYGCKYTPLQTAIFNSRPEIVKLFIKKCPLEYNDKDEAINYAIRNKENIVDFEKIIYYLDNQPEDRTDKYDDAFLLSRAISRIFKPLKFRRFVQNHDSVIKMCKNNTNLYSVSVIYDLADILSFLLSEADSKSYINNGLLQLSALTGSIPITKQLLKAGADINGKLEGMTALQIAAYKDNADLIKFLLSYQKLDPNEKNPEGRTALHIAIMNKNTKSIFELLTSRICKLDIADKNGFTPIFYAAYLGLNNIIEMLINFNDDICKTNEDGYSPLLCAIVGQHQSTVDLLIRKNALSKMSEAERKRIANYAKEYSISM